MTVWGEKTSQMVKLSNRLCCQYFDIKKQLLCVISHGNNLFSRTQSYTGKKKKDNFSILIFLVLHAICTEWEMQPSTCSVSFLISQEEKWYLAILCFHNCMKSTISCVGSNGILSSHYSPVESQNVYFKLALGIFARNFIMQL